MKMKKGRKKNVIHTSCTSATSGPPQSNNNIEGRPHPRLFTPSFFYNSPQLIVQAYSDLHHQKESLSAFGKIIEVKRDRKVGSRKNHNQRENGREKDPMDDSVPPYKHQVYQASYLHRLRADKYVSLRGHPMAV